MSALHHDPSWPQVKAGLECDIIDHMRFFRSKKQTEAFILTQYMILATDVADNTKKAAAAHIKGAVSGSTPMFYVNPTRSLKACSQQMLECYSKKDVRQVLVYRMTGLKPEEQLQGTEKALALTRAFFESFQTVFSLTENKETLIDWTMNAAVAIANFGYEEMGFIRSDAVISWEPEDLAFFGVDHSDINPTKLNCVQYALLKGRVLQAKEMIFAPPSDEMILEMLERFKEWGYRRVDMLNEGDLVLYFHNGKPSHMGCFVGDGLIQSKLGLLNSYSHTHPLFSVPMSYGSHVLFYRKGSFS